MSVVTAERRPSRERGGKRTLNGRFEAAAGGQTARDPGERDRSTLQKIDKITRRCFTFDIGRQRKNYFVEFFLVDAFEQLLDPQIFRADVVERRNPSA